MFFCRSVAMCHINKLELAFCFSIHLFSAPSLCFFFLLHHSLAFCLSNFDAMMWAVASPPPAPLSSSSSSSSSSCPPYFSPHTTIYLCWGTRCHGNRCRSRGPVMFGSSFFFPHCTFILFILFTLSSYFFSSYNCLPLLGYPLPWQPLLLQRSCDVWSRKRRERESATCSKRQSCPNHSKSEIPETR